MNLFVLVHAGRQAGAQIARGDPAGVLALPRSTVFTPWLLSLYLDELDSRVDRSVGRRRATML
jgi:hypothetical protein